MQLPISIVQMRPCSSKNSNSNLYSPGNQQLRLHLDFKMGVVSCNQSLGGLLVLKRSMFDVCNYNYIPQK